MFDSSIRNLIDPILNRVGRTLAGNGIRANMVTWLGFMLGVAAALSIVLHFYWAGLFLLVVSRICDGLDGCVARASLGARSGSDLGGFLDIVLDFAFYGMIPFAFILANPNENGVAGGLLLLVFYVNGASFLTYALMAEKQGLDAGARGSKSLLYTAGLAEAGETIAVFMLFCVFPAWFSLIALVFSLVVLVTTISRFVMAYRDFS